jgi:hypothetical protein
MVTAFGAGSPLAALYQLEIKRADPSMQPAGYARTMVLTPKRWKIGLTA